MSHTPQSALESGQEARTVQIHLSAAVDMVNHHGILYKLCSVGFGGSVLSIMTRFLFDYCTLRWMVAEVNWSSLYQECRRAVFWQIIVAPVHFGAVFNSLK